MTTRRGFVTPSFEVSSRGIGVGGGALRGESGGAYDGIEWGRRGGGRRKRGRAPGGAHRVLFASFSRRHDLMEGQLSLPFCSERNLFGWHALSPTTPPHPKSSQIRHPALPNPRAPNAFLRHSPPYFSGRRAPLHHLPRQLLLLNNEHRGPPHHLLNRMGPRDRRSRDLRRFVLPPLSTDPLAYAPLFSSCDPCLHRGTMASRTNGDRASGGSVADDG